MKNPWLKKGLLVYALMVCAVLVIGPASWAFAQKQDTPATISTDKERSDEEYKAGIEAALKVLKKDPNNIDARRHLVVAYFHLENFEKALEEQKAVIEMASTPTGYDYFNLGVIYRRVGDSTEAIEAFRKAATLFGSEASWRELAIAYYMAKDYERAADAYRKVVTLNPNDKESRLFLTRSLYNIRKYKAGASELSKLYSRKEKLLIALACFKRPGIAFLLLTLLTFLSRNRRLSTIFCEGVENEREILKAMLAILFVLVLSQLSPIFFFNPFAPYYREKMAGALWLYKSGMTEQDTLRFVLAYGVSQVVVPAYCMRRFGISIRPLFAVNVNVLKRTVLYLTVVVILTLGLASWVVLVMILFFPHISPSDLDLQTAQSARFIRTWSITGRLAVGLFFPFAEEFCFRGMVFHLLRKRFKVLWSIIFSALFFMLSHFHLSDPSLIIIFIVGIVTAYLVHKTRSLWPPYLFHAIVNSFNVLIR